MAPVAWGAHIHRCESLELIINCLCPLYNKHTHDLSCIIILLQIFVFTPNDSERELRQFNLRYNCASDTYERYTKGLIKCFHRRNLINYAHDRLPSLISRWRTFKYTRNLQDLAKCAIRIEEHFSQGRERLENGLFGQAR